MYNCAQRVLIANKLNFIVKKSVTCTLSNLYLYKFTYFKIKEDN